MSFSAAVRRAMSPSSNEFVPRRGLRPLLSFLVTCAATGVIAAAGWAVAGDPPRWPLAFLVGLPSFAVAYLLPAAQRRRTQIALGACATLIVLAVGTVAVLFLIAAANCPPDAYECPV